MDPLTRAGALALAGDGEGAANLLRAWGALTSQPAAHSYALLLSHYATADAELLYREHLLWAERHAASPPEAQPFANHRDPHRKLRIGYVSADFKDGHPLMSFIEPVLAAHDRENFFIACYSNGPAENAAVLRLRGRVDEWREIRLAGHGEAAAIIRAGQIDLLVDLSGHCAGNRLLVFARRAAPVQITWLGYPDTTGLAAMDYRLTDEIADPPGASERFHTEQLVRPARGFLCYKPPSGDLAPTALPAWFGGGVTFGSFQYPAKITGGVIGTWARILARVPGSGLFLHHCFSDYANPEGPVRARIERSFAERGVEPGRLRFAGFAPLLRQHLELHGQVDIALDTFPYNGTTTTCESLWMGVPVVTLAGGTHAGRVGKSILTRVGLPGLVASNEDEYAGLAVRLAGNLDALARLRASLRPAMLRSSLLDAHAFTRALETEYRAMWRRWCERRP